MSSARRILLVDNDPAVRKSFEQVLSGKACDVVTASSGEDALSPTW
jgi:CheY-like chemotaxis protein